MTNIQQIIKDSKFIPDIKSVLFEDCYAQLEGGYGLSKKGTFEDLSSLPNLKEGSEDYKTRKELEKFIKHKTESGTSSKESVVDFVREYAFTCVNRFVAFKMMEERKILRQTISREYESNSFKFYLADHPEDEKIWKQGKVYEAYKHFIGWQCKELCNDNEIKVLFDPSNVVSRIFPLEKTLKRIFELINQERLSAIWKEDEVIGWVYQYFIEDDKALVFDKIYTQKLKMDLTDIAPATQIFTPKWIVQFLVENTLGRLWIRMHPGTGLRDKMRYYVPNDNDKEKIEMKPVREITLLDPACGTMHFGVMAFDLFYEMYLEEMTNTGKEGWPKEFSCKDKNQVPASIIENNLFGIDIDLRSVQLSSLALYLKAKGKSKETKIEKYNLIHTDIPPFSDRAVDKFVESLSSKYELTKKLFKQVLPELSKAYYLGSLLKIEDIIHSFLEEQHKALSKQFGKQGQQNLFMKEEQHELLFKKDTVWMEVKEELRQALNDFIEHSNGDVDSFVARESKKGIYFVDVLTRKYDVVVTNPPYMGNRHQNHEITNFIKANYPGTERNLYTAFIARCIELVHEDIGFVGMITGQTFLFTSSFEKIRNFFISKNSIFSLLHFDYGLFSGVRMDSCCFTLQKKSNANPIVCFRLTDGEEDKKYCNFVEALDKFKNSQKSDKVYVLQQEKLKAIPGWPFVYWVSDKIREIFKKVLLDDVAKARQGIATADNARFLRLWWEVGQDSIHSGCETHEEAKKSSKKWFPYMKGGEVNRWYGNQEYVVNWKKDGYEIKHFFKNGKLASRPQNLEYAFQEGATYSFLTMSNLSVRYMSEGFIFDVIGSSIFPVKTNVFFLMGVLNSKLASYLIKVISPTVAYQVGDIAKIPYPDQNNNRGMVATVKDIVKKCISLKQEDAKQDENSWEFVSPIEWQEGILKALQREKDIALLETDISEAVYKLYEITHEDIDQIESEFGRLPGHLSEVKNLRDEKLDAIKSLYLEKHVPSEVLKQNNEEIDSDENEEESEEEQQPSSRRGRSTRYLTLEEVCLASEFHPNTVYEYIKLKGLEREDERFDLAVRYISYALGVVMGRFEVKGIEPDDDGITVLDEGHNDDTPARIHEVLVKVLDENQAKEVIETVGGDLRRFLMTDFFTKYHISMYKKRPVYWLLRTSKKNYGFYIYNLKFTKDTLYSLVRKYVEPRINLEKTKLEDAHKSKEKAEREKRNKEKREFEKIVDQCEQFIEEIEAFKRDIQEVIDTGFVPDIDDGVILNMAPLHKLIPWNEPQKYYKELGKGKYEWAQVSRYFK